MMESLGKLVPTLNFWFDVDGVDGGDDFEDKIMLAIEESSHVLFALSDNSLKSEWAKLEVMYAKNVGKRVIPVLLNGAKLRGWFLFRFGCIDCIDSTNPIQVKKLVKNLSVWVNNKGEKAPKLHVAVQNTESETIKKRCFTIGGVPFEMVAVEGGTFKMGVSDEQMGPDTYEDASPQHDVVLRDFYIGETVVTQELYHVVMGYNPSEFASGSQRPVDSVSFDDCLRFIEKLNALTGENFKLPSEAQWEYAARGGKFSKGFKYSGNDDIFEIAWFRRNSENSTQSVKMRNPNELGIYDMTGNVCEWCSDYYSDYPAGLVTEPIVKEGVLRVLRGGSWRSRASNCELYVRFGSMPGFRCDSYGFRLAL